MRQATTETRVFGSTQSIQTGYDSHEKQNRKMFRTSRRER